MAYAAAHNKPVIVDFSGYACVNCRKMEGAVFDTPTVRGIIERDYVMIVLMVDDKKALPEPMYVEEDGVTKKLTTVGERWSYLQYHKFGISSRSPTISSSTTTASPFQAPRVYDETYPTSWHGSKTESKNTRSNNAYTSRKIEALGRVLDTLDILRVKCPWDAKQTNESLRPNTIEEVYELVHTCSTKISPGNKERTRRRSSPRFFYAKIGSEKGNSTLPTLPMH